MFDMIKKKSVSKELSAFASKGGRKSASNLSAKERSERAKLAAKVRWDKKKVGENKNK
jgi:hypothetical protein